jgi:hypothetical protein
MLAGKTRKPITKVQLEERIGRMLTKAEARRFAAELGYALQSTPAEREKRRAAHWRRTGVSERGINWLRDNCWL